MSTDGITISVTEDVTSVTVTEDVTTIDITPSVTTVEAKGIALGTAGAATATAYQNSNTNLAVGETVAAALDHINTNGFNKNADNTIAAAKSITFPAQSPVYDVLNMNNNNITGVNHITFNDPGPNEGLIWQNVRIYESPDDLTTNVPSGAGDLQVVYKQSDSSYARRFTVRDTGVDVVGTITFDGGTTSANLDFATNARARFGDGQQLQIYSDGTTSYIDENGSGNLLIRGNNLHLQKYTGANYLTAVADGATTLFHNGNTKIATTSAGVDVTGTITFDGGTTSADLNFGDNDRARFGAGNDLQIYHNGSNSLIEETGTGELYVRSSDFLWIQSADNESMAKFNANGSVDLQFNNINRFSTTNDGIDVTGTVTFDGGTTSADLNFGDNDKAVFGAGNDLQVYHDGSDSFITDAGTGNLFIDAREFYVRNNAGVLFQSTSAGSSQMYFADNIKLATTVNGVDVTGNLSVSGQLGIGTITTGRQLHIKGSGATVAAKIEATDGQQSSLDLANTEGSFRIINDSGELSVYDDTDNAERLRIDTAGNVGIGTNNPSTKLDVNGTATATTFSGDLNGTINTATTAATQSQANNSTKVATTAYVDTAVAGVVDSAPGALNTLNELAAALGDDASFSTTVTNSIGTKLPLAGGQMTGNITFSSTQTVDGRDLSVDGAKLDLIEASADVTDATNVTAAGALMDSELTDLAGVKSLNTSTLQLKPSEGAFANGDKTKLDGIATSADAVGSTPTFTSLTLVDNDHWKFAVDVSNNLLISFDETNVMKIDSSGNLTVIGNVTAFGSI